MAWLNEEVAGLLREYAELIQITGGDVFRARNYEKAARSVRGWAEDIGQLDVKGLRAIPGVGASIAAKIAEYAATGRIAALEELRARIPAGVLELTQVPGLGPKRALQLHHDLGVSSVDELAAAIKAGRLEGLAGFGARSEERLAGGIEVYRQGREPGPARRGHAHGDGHGGRAVRGPGLPALRLRRLAAPLAGDDRGRRHPGRGRRTRPR